MRVISKDELHHQKEQFKDQISQGNIFIYPTDTIYGIGCSINNIDAIKKIRDIKKRPENKAFSIIAPSKEWIKEHCEVNGEVEKWLDKLPGPYTLILKLKKVNETFSVVNGGTDTIGVRIPNHWISGFVKELDHPIITASVNYRGEDFMTSLEDLNEDIKSRTHFILYEKELSGNPSTMVNLANIEMDLRKDRKVI
jgi:tRNA threonylcarbamoyl adenosine modification protein (Sua5/YciO/YrdC/YwlC family)